MKDYSKMTTEKLVLELDKLTLGLEMDLIMDGSGELGGVISEGYDKYFEKIYEELDKRPDYEFDEVDDDEIPF